MLPVKQENIQKISKLEERPGDAYNSQYGAEIS
jgi:hypothetical protein